ncbi:gluconate 2-dehydrogenase subunit 3 family protein [Seonamhaeicola algicola]|uniref:Gluconate 2-dehydrogenase subunit 3 family protein n=1 Tax=Seonamhaeicola algicola TaxID=1719036 RepID=A0A5C7ACP5_9FLAO|nr:gluconate 2-dehydrogenase subunit 3 family protein [Seonamhaeicola algicola]TXE06221.1 gluconate 2-dehydrogenase subunit 3 family protein [Seonamhaeicola algicola]
MNRRNALKNIGLSLGYAAVAPSALSILQSCTSEIEVWTPKLLTVDQGFVLKNIIDLILPKTEASPGALEVNVPEFIDLLAFKSYNKKDQTKFIKEIDTFILELAPNKSDDFSISDIKTETYDALLAKYLKSKPETRKSFNKNESIVFNGLKSIRSKAVWAFKNSELVGEKVLAYNPVPGPDKGCVDLQNTTKGKAWSLQR